MPSRVSLTHRYWIKWNQLIGEKTLKSLDRPLSKYRKCWPILPDFFHIQGWPLFSSISRHFCYDARRFRGFFLDFRDCCFDAPRFRGFLFFQKVNKQVKQQQKRLARVTRSNSRHFWCFKKMQILCHTLPPFWQAMTMSNNIQFEGSDRIAVW